MLRLSQAFPSKPSIDPLEQVALHCLLPEEFPEN
jgi:hypothetical protein